MNVLLRLCIFHDQGMDSVHRYLFNRLLFILLFGLPLTVSAANTLSIKTDSKSHTFTYELASTPEEQEKGLMFRTSMPKNHGMLFVFPQEQMAYFWMKNTRISLDLLFIDRNGYIVTIAKNAKPESLDIIASDVPVKAVLEINGGLAASLGIQKGNRVTYEK
jgi:uncharacterized membrane protein (UPF0127 family)